jgi:hypothetical protein
MKTSVGYEVQAIKRPKSSTKSYNVQYIESQEFMKRSAGGRQSQKAGPFLYFEDECKNEGGSEQENFPQLLSYSSQADNMVE